MAIRDNYQLSADNFEDLKSELNFLLQRIADRIDKMEGIRGDAEIQSDLDLNGKKILNADLGGDAEQIIARRVFD